MAIKPGYKQFTFDGKNSGDYGVYITGSAVYNSPERDVELIEIPGRNGSFVLDNGRFENIEVTYPAGIYAESQEDFAQAISDLRNMLSSRKGYCRLTDEYNPEEYRMAVYKSGLDVDPVAFQRAGEFNITFDCKPQRWLTSGEQAVTMTSGDKLSNPTPFESSPLLEATGSGSIEFNGYDIEFAGVPYGEVVIGEKKTQKSYMNDAYMYRDLDTSLLNVGDRVYPETKECVIIVRLRLQTSGDFLDVSIGSTTNVLEAKTAIVPGEGGAIEQYLDLYLYPDFGDGFVYDTTEQIVCTAEYNYRIRGGSTVYTETVQVTLDYTVTDYLIDVRSTGAHDYNVGYSWCWITAPTMYGDSSKLVSVPIFIDCDLGEAYIVENGVYRSLNQFIDLGSELPKLGAGETEVTFDNTITQLKMTPRWWKV